MQLTVDKLYKYSSTNNMALLGSAPTFDFWLPYKQNYSVFDRFFRDRFLSWFYWLKFADDTTTAEVYNDFIAAVNSHLTINAKRYSELYKVQILAADAYDIVNNYDLTETHTASRSESTTDISGQRTDTTTNSTTDGARQDTTSRTLVDGAREDETSVTTVDGARSDSGSTTVGAATNTSEKEIAGFNSSDYSDADKQTDTLGTHTDTTSVSKGAQTNTNDTTLNKGEQTNTDNSTFSKGAQLNSASGSAVKGQETDTHSMTGSETISIRRSGNIGVQTAAEIIGGHIELWDSFNFYGKIFDEIAKEYLIIL